MLVNEIRRKITLLANTHASEDEDGFGDIKYVEYLEEEALDLIFPNCNDQGYMVRGFFKDVPEGINPPFIKSGAT